MLSILKKIAANTPSSLIIILAMFAGLIIGSFTSTLFTGVDEIANAFVMLMQMTALPYIALSLITGIGSLSPTQASSTVKHSLVILLSLLVLVLFFVLLAPITFPNWQSADFYSLSTLKASTDYNLVDLFIPKNPFNAFANGLIPSIVLFSIFVGIGLMQVKDKEATLISLTGLNSAIINVNSLVMKFAPLGIFCIALRAAVTLDSSQIDGLLVYIVTSCALVMLLAFMILPAIVSIITPLGYKQVFRAFRKPMITGFATGSYFIVIPLIVEKAKALIEEISDNNNVKEEALSIPNIIVPITFSLPIGGKLLALLFTLFAAWFTGSHVDFSDYVNLIIAGLPQLFGSSTAAVPALLDLFNVSGAMFDFFLIAENLIVGRLSALFSVIFTVSLVLLIATSVSQKFTFNWRKFSISACILPIISILVFNGLRLTLDSISYQYKGYQKFIERDFISVDIKATVLKEPDAVKVNQPRDGTDVLSRIKDRGFIRVGYFRDDLPYAFHNSEGKLVGFDIEIINLLADDLNVSVEFVRIFHKEAKSLLSSGYLDMTTGVPVLPNNMKKYTLTIPYSTQPIAFIVKKSRRREFTKWRTILEQKDLIIGVPELYFSENIIKRHFDLDKVWEISTPRLYFREEYKHIDAMLFGAATASAWTLLHPNYTVVAPSPAIAPLSMAFAINTQDNAFELFMRNWIDMKTQNHDIKELFDYWIAGKVPKSFSRIQRNK
jgi:Na+/H+-dicarboxylate symporter/ABC-type amino acid transport substrate-binding protein